MGTPQYSFNAPALADIWCQSNTNTSGATVTMNVIPPTGRTAVITSMTVTGTGATAAVVSSVTISSVLTITGSGSLTFYIAVPAGATSSITPLVVTFEPFGICAAAPSTTVPFSVGAFGAGATATSLVVTGFWV